jgi:uncharacterized protein YutE (UPF0331/DUF86 family)
VEHVVAQERRAGRGRTCDAGERVGGARAGRDVDRQLARNHVLTPEHARELAAVASVRNRIAHGYASIDPGRLWAELPAGLDALDRYVEAIARLAGDEP